MPIKKCAHRLPRSSHFPLHRIICRARPNASCPTVSEALLAQPGFPRRASCPTAPAHRLGLAPAAGLGVLATRPLRMLELVLAERSLVLVLGPRGNISPGQCEARRRFVRCHELLFEIVPHRPRGIIVVRELTARNHSCAPNATVLLRTSSLSMDLIALRHIAAGEQITVCYCDPLSKRRVFTAALRASARC
ncbi:hypothetical protein OBBRIDRAFT_835850 [Obba rivulosa]|uniref:SET domain-containing protein n=1 Tax=Obba rivulosa TaxID=1052685 RepID=A0A8E2DIJ1_9APHY|nr:hypothetical protein OBBRIDRAFT_835850 [Obba rivulosa]